MKFITLSLLTLFTCAFQAQITPSQSPYNADGPHNVVSDSNEVNSPNILWYRPDTPGNYPVFMFQPGANGFFSNEIDRHSYDLYLEHLASYGYVVLVVDETAAGLPNGNGFTSVYDWFMQEYSNGGWPTTYCDTNKIAIGGHSNGGVNATNVILNHPADVDAIVYMASYPSDNFLLPHDVSNYPGYVLSLSGSEDTDSEPATCKTGFDAFTSVNCGVYVELDGVGHGGFGDYDNTAQPVGTIGRADATSSVKHYLVSFLEYTLKGNSSAEFDLLLPTQRLDSELTYESSCVANTSSIVENNLEVNISTQTEGFSISSDHIIEEYQIYNLQGQMIEVNQVKSNTFEIYKTNLSTGCYILKLNSAVGSRNVKIVVN